MKKRKTKKHSKLYSCLMVGILIVLIATLFISPIYDNLIKPELVVTTNFPNVIQKVLPSVVHVRCPQWQGSGFAITEDIICTARHVVDGVDYEITLNDGTVVYGNQAVSHKDYDVGFIKVGIPILKPMKFGSIKDCVLGQQVFIIGSPYGKINFNSVTLGIISGLDRNWDGIDYYTGEKYGWEIAFTSDSGAHPGNSGGPVCTMDGVARGILVGGYSPVLNCSMPCDLFLYDIPIIKILFSMDNYKTEKEENYKSIYVNSREDYYTDDEK